MSPQEETIVPFPSPVVPARHARSTILLGSMASIRELGRFDEYTAHLPHVHRETLLSAIAGTWMPIEVALAHYEACEALGLPVERQVANGRVTFDKTRGTLMGTMVRMARESGVTPWTVCPYFQRFWERGYDGGGLSVTKLGPKEARMDVVQVQLNECRYYRHAVRGLATAVFELFCQKAYVAESRGPRAPASVSFRIQWV
ncbi:MAG: hypothetical protein ACLQVI_34355 [Polyangiaceae bacterium]